MASKTEKKSQKKGQNQDFSRLCSYVDGVKSGAIPSCMMVRKAVERWEDDLRREDLYFDRAVFEKFCRFSRQFKHYKGALAGQFFEPEDWQLFVFANCIGLRRPTDAGSTVLPTSTSRARTERPSLPPSSPFGSC